MTASHDHRTIAPERMAALVVAAELQVDEDEVGLTDEAERVLWADLRAEFDDLLDRIGPVWIAD